MKFLLVRTEPVQEIAAEPDTLTALIDVLRATVPAPTSQPSQISALTGIDLVNDPALLPGTVHLRPRKAH